MPNGALTQLATKTLPAGTFLVIAKANLVNQDTDGNFRCALYNGATEIEAGGAQEEVSFESIPLLATVTGPATVSVKCEENEDKKNDTGNAIIEALQVSGKA